MQALVEQPSGCKPGARDGGRLVSDNAWAACVGVIEASQARSQGGKLRCGLAGRRDHRRDSLVRLQRDAWLPGLRVPGSSVGSRPLRHGDARVADFDAGAWSTSGGSSTRRRSAARVAPGPCFWARRAECRVTTNARQTAAPPRRRRWQWVQFAAIHKLCSPDRRRSM